MNEKSEKEILEKFIVNNPELEKLEEIINTFNIFDALNMVYYEIRHSIFLSWLMNPQESHGLKDYFLKSFLKTIALKASTLGIKEVSVFDIDYWDFDNAEILREWRNIDILIRCDEQKFICAIENKIHSKEHDNQLQKYKKTIKNEYPGYKKLFVYLTVEGDLPSDDEYIPLSYVEIVPIIEHLIESKKDQLGSEILSFISNYKDMLRRHIMKDSEIQELCRRIYQRHKKALDLIFEYKPDKLSEIHDCLVEIIKKDSDLILDDSSKSYIRFIPKSLDFIPKLGGGWTKSKRILLFEFQNTTQGLSLSLIIGPGSVDRSGDIRKILYNKAKENTSIFNKSNRELTPQWFTIYKKSVLKPKEYEDKDIEKIKTNIEKIFEKIKNKDLYKIVKKIEEIEKEVKEFNKHST